MLSAPLLAPALLAWWGYYHIYAFNELYHWQQKGCRLSTTNFSSVLIKRRSRFSYFSSAFVRIESFHSAQLAFVMGRD
jgi:hypothetical protein